jgi:alpha-tubulin suppressor-like RCC1 family protein
MRNDRFWWLLVGAGAVLAATACGSDDDDDDRTPEGGAAGVAGSEQGGTGERAGASGSPGSGGRSGSGGTSGSSGTGGTAAVGGAGASATVGGAGGKTGAAGSSATSGTSGVAEMGAGAGGVAAVGGTSGESGTAGSAETPAVGGAAGSAGDAGGVGGLGSLGDAGSAGDVPVAGTGGEGGEAGAGAGGAGGLGGCGLGDPCCAGDVCQNGLNCLGELCSCVQSIVGGYIIRTDGRLLFSDNGSQSVVREGIDPIENIEHAFAGRYHGCAVKSDGSAWCWSTNNISGNNFGQLGNGTVGGTFPLYGASQVQIEPAASDPEYLTDVVDLQEGSLNGTPTVTTCAVRTDTTVWCWGDQTDGNLINSVAGGESPYAAPILADATTTFTGASQVAVGVEHACVVVSGSVYCWGRNNMGQLGVGDQTDRDYPIQVPGLDQASKVVAEYATTCALRNGSVYCWGLNNQGQLGIGDPAANDDCSTNHCKLIPTRVQVAGNQFLTGVVDIQAGYQGMCAERQDHTVWCWGFNDSDVAVAKERSGGNPVADVADYAILYNELRFITQAGDFYEGNAPRDVNCGLL